MHISLHQNISTMETLKFRKILIPTDFSENAQTALNFATEIGKELHYEVFLLHTYHVPVYHAQHQPDTYAQLVHTIKENSLLKLKEIEVTIKEKLGDKKVHLIHKEGLLVDVIKDVVVEEEIDLIMMGTKGSSSFDEYVVGSNTAAVVENTHCPVFVIPSKAIFHPINRILFATDFQFDDILSIERLVPLAKAYDADLKIVHISDNPNQDEDKIEWLQEIAGNRINYNKISFTNIEKNNSTLQALNQYIKDENIDLFALNSTSKNLFKRLFTGSVSREMLYHSHIPFFAFHVRSDSRI